MLKRIIQVLILAYIIHFVFISQPVTEKDFDLTLEQTHELEKDGNILDERGNLKEVGWSFSKFKTINMENAGGPLFGIQKFAWLKWKKYDYYEFYGEKTIIQVYIVDMAFKQFAFLKTFNYDTHEGSVEATALNTILGDKKDIASYPHTHKFGDHSVSFSTGGVSYVSDDKNGVRTINFKSSTTEFNLQIEVGKFKGDAMVDILPLSDTKSAWFYNEKYYNIPCKATYTKDGKTQVFEKNTGITIDIGRGFLNYHNDMLLVNGVSNEGGKKLSFTFQNGLTASKERKSVADYLFVGDEGTRLHPIKFKVDTLNWNNSMRFYTEDDDLLEQKAPGTADVSFVCLGNLQEVDDSRIFKVHLVHVYGYFTGYFVDKNGTEHKIDGVKGTFESFYAKV